MNSYVVGWGGDDEINGRFWNSGYCQNIIFVDEDIILFEIYLVYLFW